MNGSTHSGTLVAEPDVPPALSVFVWVCVCVEEYEEDQLELKGIRCQSVSTLLCVRGVSESVKDSI